jgi:deoxyadenosine kinase
MRIAIEGAPGVGKSTLCQQIGALFPCQIVTEPVEDNYYLADYYLNPARWALAMQIDLLTRRVTDAARTSQLSGVVLHDRSLWGDRIFGLAVHNMGLMDEREFKTYDRVFRALMEKAFLPDLILYLRATPDVIWERVKARARAAESVMPKDYLDKVIDQYERFFQDPPLGAVVTAIDWNTYRKPQDVIEILMHHIRQ